MKKLLLFSAIVSICFLNSCSSGSDDDDPIVTPPPSNSVTYANTISAIMGSNCNNCHSAPPKNGAPMALNTYALVKAAVQNRGLISRLDDGSMPPAGKLPAATIQSIKTWQATNFPE